MRIGMNCKTSSRSSFDDAIGILKLSFPKTEGYNIEKTTRHELSGVFEKV